jgi:hypothetical protein
MSAGSTWLGEPVELGPDEADSDCEATVVEFEKLSSGRVSLNGETCDVGYCIAVVEQLFACEMYPVSHTLNEEGSSCVSLSAGPQMGKVVGAP